MRRPFALDKGARQAGVPHRDIDADPLESARRRVNLEWKALRSQKPENNSKIDDGLDR